MPLPPTEYERKHLHLREIDCHGYQRADGLFDIEARMTDRKTYDIVREDGGRNVSSGDAVHDISLRVTVDPELRVRAVLACIDASPFVVCPEAVEAMQGIVGLQIGGGWNRAVKEILGGAKGCTHLMEMLGSIATTAYQTLIILRWAKPVKRDGSGKPVKIDSCYAYRGDGPVVLRRWPNHYSGRA